MLSRPRRRGTARRGADAGRLPAPRARRARATRRTTWCATWLARGVPRHAHHAPPATPGASAPLSTPASRRSSCPYRTFPLAGRRGHDHPRPEHGVSAVRLRAGRQVARELVERGEIDLVHGLGASVLGYALRAAAAPERRAPLVLNPQGLEEFGGIDGSYGGRPLKRIGYAPLRRGRARLRARPPTASSPPTARSSRRSRRTSTSAADRMRLVPERARSRRVRRAGDARRRRAGAGRGRYRAGRDRAAQRRRGSSRTRAFTCWPTRWRALHRRWPWRWVLVGRRPVPAAARGPRSPRRACADRTIARRPR